MHKKWLLVLLFANTSFSFNIIYKMPGYKTDFLPAEVQQITAILEKFEWPSSVNLFADSSGKIINKKNLSQFSDLLKKSGMTETDFLRMKLKEVSPLIEVAWIPQTLWDLISLLATHEKNLKANDFKGRQDLTRFAFDKYKKFGSLSNLLSFKNEDINKKTIYALLKRFENSGEGYVYGPVKDALINESMMENNQSPVMNAIKQDIEAHKLNKVLLYRATNGIALRKNKPLRALDFIVPAVDEDKSISAAVDNLSSLVANDNYRSLDLSFQYSLLGGCNEDPGICPYYYYNGENFKILYALSLDRSFAQLRAHQLIFFPTLEASNLITQEGFLGHPRFRIIGQFSRSADEESGGDKFKFGFYQPLEIQTDNIKLKKYLSFLLESATVLSKNSIIIAIHEDSGEPILSAAQLKQGQQLALALLKEKINSILAQPRFTN